MLVHRTLHFPRIPLAASKICLSLSISVFRSIGESGKTADPAILNVHDFVSGGSFVFKRLPSLILRPERMC